MTNSAYYNIFNDMPEIMAIFQVIKDDQGKPKDVIIKDVNQTYVYSLNIPREKIIDQRASSIYGSEIVDNYLKLAQNNLEIGKEKKIETYFPQLDKYYLTTIFAVGNDIYVNLSIDITDRKTFENKLNEERDVLDLKVQEKTKELLESEEKFREIFNKANDMITLAEINEDGLPGKYLEVNDVGIKRLGYTRHEFLNMEPIDIIADDKKKDIIKYAIDLWTKGHSTFEMVHVTKDGKRIPVEISNHLFKMNGKNVALAIVRDITKRKKSENELNNLLEKLSHSNEELERFAYITSHDLKEPLRALSNFSEILKKRYEGKFDEYGDELIDYIVDTSNQIQNMIHDLFEYSQISLEKGKFKPVDLKKIFENVLMDLQDIINKYNVVITAEHLPTVLAHDKQIARVFNNLIIFAIKSQNGIKDHKIHISCSKNLKNSEYIISIYFNKVLIVPQYAEGIFTKFQYLTTNRIYEGSFIDLVTSKKIIEMHDGRIWLESKPNIGTTFYFSLPLKI